MNPKNSNKIGLSLSGGGYRASAFHLGTLKKLHEMNILEKVDVMSTISGGSITGAAWCLYKGDYNRFHEEMITKLNTKSVIKYIFTSGTFMLTALFVVIFLVGAIYISFTSWHSLTFPILIAFFFLLYKYQFRLFPVSKVIERAYDSFFCDGKTLKDLCEKPLLAIGSSNLHTGRPFTFSCVKMSDSTYTSDEYNPHIYFKHEKFPVSRAVMASSCVPFAFTPIEIDKGYYKFESDYYRIKPVLIDGGVYDNQGIQKITQANSTYECGIIITSDAGGNFIGEKKYPNAIALLVRTVDLFMFRIKTGQMVANIYNNVKGAAKPIAYFSLGWRINKAIPGFIENMIKGQVLKSVIDAHGFDQTWIDDPTSHATDITNHLKKRVDWASIEKKDLTDEQWDIARTTRTNLSRLSADQIKYLIIQAENFTELQVKLYCPMLVSQELQIV